MQLLQSEVKLLAARCLIHTEMTEYTLTLRKGLRDFQGRTGRTYYEQITEVAAWRRTQSSACLSYRGAYIVPCCSKLLLRTLRIACVVHIILQSVPRSKHFVSVIKTSQFGAWLTVHRNSVWIRKTN